MNASHPPSGPEQSAPNHKRVLPPAATITVPLEGLTIGTLRWLVDLCSDSLDPDSIVVEGAASPFGDEREIVALEVTIPRRR